MFRTMFNIRMLCLLCSLSWVCLACTDTDEWLPQPEAARSVTLEVGSKISYRVQGCIEEADKANTRLATNGLSSSWEVGDVLYIVAKTSSATNAADFTLDYVTATYAGSDSWNVTPSIKIPEAGKTLELRACYAPGTYTKASQTVSITENSNVIIGKSSVYAAGTSKVELEFSFPLTRIEVKNADIPLNIGSTNFSASVDFPSTLNLANLFGSNYFTAKTTKSISADGVYYVNLEGTTGDKTVTCNAVTLKLSPAAGSYAGLSYTIDCKQYPYGAVTPDKQLRGIWSKEEFLNFVKAINEGTTKKEWEKNSGVYKVLEGDVVNLYVDINMKGNEYTPCVMPYSFNGHGHTISDLNIVNTGKAGLFLKVDDPDVVIKNLTLKNIGITVGSNVYYAISGGVVAEMTNGAVIACTVEGSIEAYTNGTDLKVGGGIVAKATKGAIIGCSFVGTLSGSGGLNPNCTMCGITTTENSSPDLAIVGCYSDARKYTTDSWTYGIVMGDKEAAENYKTCYYLQSEPNKKEAYVDMGVWVSSYNYKAALNDVSGVDAAHPEYMGSALKKWNEDHANFPKLQCDYHYEKGTSNSSYYPYLAKGKP